MILPIPRSLRTILAAALAAALLVAGPPFIPVPATGAAEGIALPFPEGRAVRIIQGYNGGTHQGRSRYGLDLVLADGGTSGAEVVSPIEGAVTWAQGPGAGNGCLAVGLRDGSYSVMLCHVLLNRAYRPGESIARGQSLGTVGPAGSVGNNGTPHVHLELHRGRGANSPVPFSPPEGLPLEGIDLPASGEHARRTPIVATTRPAGRAETAAPEGRPRTVPEAARAQSAPPAAAPAPARDGRAQPPLAGTAAQAPASLRAAVVRGTESCLNVRERASTDARIVDCLPEGTEVPLVSAATSSEDGWRPIEGRGWAASEYLKRTRAVVSGTEGCLNVRERPTTDAPILGCLDEGTSVAIAEGPVTENALEWYRIERAQPAEKGGWVAGQYLD